MIIHVTKDDIEKGRLDAPERCGCPIWQAVVRELGIPEDKAEDLVEIPDYEHLLLGTTKFFLPPEAVSFQRVLVEFPSATVEEITFVAPVVSYGKAESEKKDKDDDDDDDTPEATAIEASAPVKKPSLLERIFA